MQDSMSSTDQTQRENTDDVVEPSRTRIAPSTASKSTWKLEESSIWWLSYFWEPSSSSGWLNKPGNILLLTSVPFFAGAYFGYRMPTEQLEDLIQGHAGGSRNTSREVHKAKAANQDAIRAAAARTASKALRIATLGTVGTFGFVGAIGFYFSGYDSIEEAVKGTSTWASSCGKSLEQLMGGDQAISKTHPEVLATKHMDGNEELRYIYDKYIKEYDDKDGEYTSRQDFNDTKNTEDPAPTLYSIYEKYFVKKDDD
eukprot:CAMPEP_0172401870 /NCGR_PEP_ID=MMETSP1061-20121228/52298_1 /TAXON_ID=37318 /ORGANISM="Pseudo-nitzschia pungens, Strain cf. pungens" /LENGTH=255 /DNA_ID=CAMNT_0013135663 /DNA_START=113 /DNA_END=880 /DNA_ORIENTATION=+